MLRWAALWAALWAPAAGAHSISKCSLTLAVDDAGEIKIALELTERDVLDIFDVDLSAPDEVPRFRPVLEQRLGKFLRLSDRGRGCPVSDIDDKQRGGRIVEIHARARCPDPPVETLRLDWGFSALSRLRLVGFVSITGPRGQRFVDVLSRKKPRLEVTLAEPSVLETLADFVTLGFGHILEGWDHLAFLLVLLLGCARPRRVLVVVTGFTLAHSVTLALGALDAVHVPPALVEIVIALSIAGTAASGLFRLSSGALHFPGSAGEAAESGPPVELLAALGFGLVHGLGFSTLLREALSATPSAGTALPLLGFNVGVELGQLMCVLIAYPLLVWVGRAAHGRRVVFALLVGLVALGLFATGARAIG